MKQMAHGLLFNRHQVLALCVSWLSTGVLLAGCSHHAHTFKT